MNSLFHARNGNQKCLIKNAGHDILINLILFIYLFIFDLHFSEKKYIS